MLKQLSKHLAAFVFGVSTLLAQPAQAELIADPEGTKITYLEPLRTGISALSLVWNMHDTGFERMQAVAAGLTSTLSGGTQTRSSYKIDSYAREKGIRHSVDIHGPHLMLTISAPAGVFPETLVHLENTLLEATYSGAWYARALEVAQPVIATLTRRPEHVLDELASYLNFAQDAETPTSANTHFQFGRPSQAVLRSGDEEVERRTFRLIRKLPMGDGQPKSLIKTWTDALLGAPDYSLPRGVIHFPDPTSTEMLILFVKAQEFEVETDQVATNLLKNYIGNGQGSEMFRVIRQEMRAAYDPQSSFYTQGKNKALMSMSATVEASRWPEVLGTIRGIYEQVRAGEIDREGLNILRNNLNRHYFESFFNDPIWGMRHYLDEYPVGAEGPIELPLFRAFSKVSADGIAETAPELLPPLDDYLLILMGGGESPSAELIANGYCALPRNTPLSHCLDQLESDQN